MTGDEIVENLRSRVPPRYRSHLSAIRVPDAAFEALTGGNSVFLYGEVGTGKTTLAAAIAFQWLEQKIRAREQEGKDFEDIKHKVKDGELLILKTYLELMFEVRSSYEAGTSEKLRDTWRRCRIFFIDDLFSGRATENANEELFGVINHRYSWTLPTVVTSNKRPEELAGIEDRIASRLFGDGSFVLEVKGEDRRTVNLKKAVFNG